MTQFHTSPNCKECENCNSKSPLFRILPGDDLAILNNNRYEVKFKAGENIIKQGTAASHMISLTTGLAKMYIEGFNNRNLILKIVKPWQVFGGPGIYIDNRYHYSVTALEPVAACFIDVNNFKEVVRRNPDFMELYMRNQSQNTSRTYERFISLTQKQMHGRIADVLIYLSNEIYASPDFDLTISRQDIADLSSMSKDSAIRILKELEHEGVITANGKKIEIKQLDVLKEIALRG